MITEKILPCQNFSLGVVLCLSRRKEAAAASTACFGIQS